MDEMKEAVEQQPEQKTELAVQSDAITTFNWMDKKALAAVFSAAKGISSSALVPANYKNDPWSTLIAMEMANRTGFSLLHVMQNLYVIQGKPSWSGQFCTAAVNASGKFSPLTFVRLVKPGTDETNGYYAKATRLSDGAVCEGSPVTWEMVTGESWLNKSGSKWKTMPDLMFHYRAAAFFVREFCPEVLCGLQTSEEVQDVKGWEQPKETVAFTL